MKCNGQKTYQIRVDDRSTKKEALIAAFMADSQVPWGVNALAGGITEPAWRSNPVGIC